MNVRFPSVKQSAAGATTAPSLAARKKNVSVFQDSHFLSLRKMYFYTSRKPLDLAGGYFTCITVKRKIKCKADRTAKIILLPNILVGQY